MLHIADERIRERAIIVGRSCKTRRCHTLNGWGRNVRMYSKK
jgi:hypothetical protein